MSAVGASSGVKGQGSRSTKGVLREITVEKVKRKEKLRRRRRPRVWTLLRLRSFQATSQQRFQPPSVTHFVGFSFSLQRNLLPTACKEMLWKPESALLPPYVYDLRSLNGPFGRRRAGGMSGRLLRTAAGAAAGSFLQQNL